jgi:hypothetical protein
VVAGLAALVVVSIYQRARIKSLAAETAILQQQLQQQASLRKNSAAETEPKEADGSNLAASLPEDQSRELLRLRGEVGVLRRQLAEVLDQPAKGQPKQRLLGEQTGTFAEADLNDEQRKSLADWTSKLQTGNSVADLARLQDSLERWDELFMNRIPAEQKPVFAILKERVKERIAELEGKK